VHPKGCLASAERRGGSGPMRKATRCASGVFCVCVCVHVRVCNSFSIYKLPMHLQMHLEMLQVLHSLIDLTRQSAVGRHLREKHEPVCIGRPTHVDGLVWIVDGGRHDDLRIQPHTIEFHSCGNPLGLGAARTNI
jgi:hypothetical protein